MIMKLREKKGFTLAELLVVVAIIAVLVGISIPIFSAQLEKAKESTDLANFRAAYAECSAEILNNGDGTTGYAKAVTVTQNGPFEKVTATIGDKVIDNKVSFDSGTTVYVKVDANGSVKIETSIDGYTEVK